MIITLTLLMNLCHYMSTAKCNETLKVPNCYCILKVTLKNTIGWEEPMMEQNIFGTMVWNLTQTGLPVSRQVMVLVCFGFWLFKLL